EAVVRDGAPGDGLRHPLARAPEPAAEPLLDVAGEAAGPDAVEELVADPVGLDDPPVERVVDPVLGGDQREVRPGALERAGELAEAAVGLARGAVLEQRPRAVDAAPPTPPAPSPPPRGSRRPR